MLFNRIQNRAVCGTLSALLLILQITTSWGAFAAEMELSEGGEKRSFLVSAYYSPLPNQTRYLRGNYEDEIKLNGRGTNGASGKEVYPGMLAAPKSYAFGTKIYLPNLGIGTVHDRGGAIIAGADYDRIDVWMGSGEEGLARALQWGMRRVEGVVYAPEAPVEESFGFDHLPAPQSVLTQLQGIFSQNLSSGSEGEEVRKLQKYLQRLGFFSGPETGRYDSLTEEAVFAFQKSVHLVSAFDEYGAGVFGPKTRSLLEKKLQDIDVKQEQESIAEIPTSSQSSLLRTTFLPERLEPGAKGKSVKRLQVLLANLGYFEGEFSEYYGSQTTAAVLAFQQQEELAEGFSSPGAGIFGPKTHSALAQTLNDFAANQKELPREMVLAFGEEADNSEEVRPQRKEHAERVLVGSLQLAFGFHGKEVNTLQEKLLALRLLNSDEVTGFYGKRTKAAVIALQKRQGLIQNEKTPWAGVFGPKTEVALWQALDGV